MAHVSVLKKEAIESLQLKSDSVVVDCTLGAGGHAEAIIEQLGSSGTYIGIDVDKTAIDAVHHLHKRDCKNIHFVNDNFSNIAGVVAKIGCGSADAILADLGWRTEQFLEGGKGFSFQKSEPLHMTYGDPRSYTFTAHDIVNTWDETSIADVIYGYGEERGSRLIARAIVAARQSDEIRDSLQLATIVADALPAVRKRGKIHPATKTFQALRIAVNDEFGALKKLLTDGFDLLRVHGRMSIITFHSLEDRIVKRHFKSFTHDQKGVLVYKKPLTPSEEEVKENPRARSAKLRTIEKLQ